MPITTPRQMINLNCKGGIGIVHAVLWVRLTKHQNPYIEDPQPVGLLRILEIGMDGQVIKATFSEGGTKPFVDLSDPGFRHTAFEVTARVAEGD